jgi:hypothetical protein
VRTRAHRTSFGRRTLWIALIVGVAGVVGAILLMRGLDTPQTLSEKLGDLMLVEGHHSCLNGQASRERFTAAERPDLYPDLLPRARSVENVSCEYGGEVSTMVHFENRHELQRAFRRSSSAKSSGWCVVDASAFDGAYLDHPWSLRYYCNRLHGTLRPGPYQVSQTGS